jgi:hypothetical protein
VARIFSTFHSCSQKKQITAISAKPPEKSFFGVQVELSPPKEKNDEIEI